MVSVVVPTLNEVDNIDPLLSALFDAVRDEPFAAEVIVVDDASTDGTRDRVRRWMGDHPVRLVERDEQRGLAGAVLAGAGAASGDVVVVMDADLSHPPQSVGDLVSPILADKSDMVIGSRYIAGGSTPGWPRRRRFVSRVASWLAWPLVDVRDPMSGFFAVRRDNLLKVSPKANGFKIGLEVIACNGASLRVIEHPIAFEDRRYGRSKLGAGQVISYLDRLRALAGHSVSSRTMLRFGTVGLCGMVVDLICFQALFFAGLTLASSHIFSFLVATVFNYTFNARWSFKDTAGVYREAGWERYARFLTVALMALVLRGAVLGTLVFSHGWPPSLAIIAGIGAAFAVNYLGSAFFVFPSASTGIDPAVRWRVAAIGVVAYLLALRLFYMDLPNLLMEEAYYWNYAQHPALSYLDHPPMVAWLIWLGTGVFGDTEFGVRIGALLCWIVTAGFGYMTAREMFDKSTAFRAVLLLAVLPFFFFFSFFMTPDAPLTACWAGALYFLHRALLLRRPAAWWGVGVCMGLGMLSKYTIALLGPATLVFLLLDRDSRRWLWNPRPYAAALLSLLLFCPVILWNIRHDWASFAFQSTGRMNENTEFGWPVLAGSLLLLLTPVGLIAAIMALLKKSSAEPASRGHHDEGSTARFASRRKLFAAVYTLTPLLVFIVFSLKHEPKLNWVGPLWLATIPLLAWYMVPRSQPNRSVMGVIGGRVWPTTIVVTVLAYGIFLHYMSLGIPGAPYPVKHMLAGWPEFGQWIEQYEEMLEEHTGQEPLVVGLGKYGITSRLAFYRHQAELNIPDHPDGESVKETTGRHLFGGNSLMYELWHPIENQAGRTMIIVHDSVKDLADESIDDCFDRITPIRTVNVRTRGRITGRFYYRVGYGYRGPSDPRGVNQSPFS